MAAKETLEEELSLPEIEKKPLTSIKTDQSFIKKRPTSGSKNAFPRMRKFSYESQEHLKQLERGFVLDGVALNRLANEETDRTNPSLNIGIPQYKAQEDKHCKAYFKMKSLPQKMTTDSMVGGVEDKLVKTTEAWHYLEDRKRIGSGYTRRLYGGHTTVPTDPAMDGYNGPEGYRQNTFDLRRKPSVFDYEDPFDNPKPVNRHLRTQSAPATIRMMRQKSATVYKSHPAGSNRRAMSATVGSHRIHSAIPRTLPTLEPVRELATGPMC